MTVSNGIEETIKSGESETVEFKQSLAETREIVVTEVLNPFRTSFMKSPV